MAKASKNFEEFIRFCQTGLNPNKFGPNSKVVCFQEFEFTFCCEFELASKRRVVPYLSFHQSAMFGIFWSIKRVVFIIYKFGSV
jgi:hypothetical protein